MMSVVCNVEARYLLLLIAFVLDIRELQAAVLHAVVGLDGGGDKLVGETGFESDPLVVVLGSEGSGLGRLVRETCDAIAGIPISSSVESLNASVAAGISLYAVSNARRKAAAE